MADNITKDELEQSIKATKSIKSLMDNGPLMTILSILTLAVSICIWVMISTVKDSRDREVKLQKELYEKLINQAAAAGATAGTKAAKREVSEKVVPTIKRIDTTASKIDSTLTVITNKRR